MINGTATIRLAHDYALCLCEGVANCPNTTDEEPLRRRYHHHSLALALRQGIDRFRDLLPPRCLCIQGPAEHLALSIQLLLSLPKAEIHANFIELDLGNRTAYVLSHHWQDEIADALTSIGVTPIRREPGVLMNRYPDSEVDRETPAG